MSGAEARTMDGGTTGTNEIRHDASTAAERLGWPLEVEQSRDAASDAQTDIGGRADSTAGEGERSPDTATEAKSNADRQVDSGVRQRTSLIEPERAESYNGRWKELKGEFVDDPRRAVRGANELVGEVLDELEELFRRHRTDLEQGLDSEQTTTEDLRQALIRSRSFFDRRHVGVIPLAPGGRKPADVTRPFVVRQLAALVSPSAPFPLGQGRVTISARVR